MNGNLRALLILIILIVVATITYYIVKESKTNSDSDQDGDKKGSTDSDQDGDKKGSTDSDQDGDKKGLFDNINQVTKNVGDAVRDAASKITNNTSSIDPETISNIQKGVCNSIMKINNAESYELVDGKCKFTCPKDYKLIRDGAYCIKSNTLMGISNLCKKSQQYKSVSFDEDAAKCTVECNSPLYIEGEGNSVFNKKCLPNESDLIEGFDCQFGRVATIDISKVSPSTGIPKTFMDADKLVGYVSTEATASPYYNYAELSFDDGYAHGTAMKIVKLDDVPTEFKDSANTISCTKRK
jgi:hypothetical protein